VLGHTESTRIQNLLEENKKGFLKNKNNNDPLFHNSSQPKTCSPFRENKQAKTIYNLGRME
jgi:hypothetical protein